MNYPRARIVRTIIRTSRYKEYKAMATNVQIKGFTRTGFEIVFNESINSKQDLQIVLGKMSALGILNERLEKPDETDYCMITAVALTKKEDGTLHMAYYHQNEKLETRITHKYFDSAHDDSEFEQWSGLKIADLPVKEDNDHPKRTAPSAKRYIVELPEPRALIRLTSHYKQDEEWKHSHDVERYIMPRSGNAPAPQTPNPDSSSAQSASHDAPTSLDAWKASDKDKEAVRAYLVEEGISEDEAIDIAGVGKWDNLPNATVALKVIREKREARPTSHFGSYPGGGTDGFRNHRQRQADNDQTDPNPVDDESTGPVDQIPEEEINF